MSSEKKQKAEALLNAQIDFHIAEMQGDRLEAVIKEEMDSLFTLMETQTLNEAVSAEKLKQTVKKYLVNLDIPDAIPERLDAIAEFMLTHNGLETNKLGDILSDDEFSNLLQKGLAMETLRTRAIDEFVENPVFTGMISDLLYSAIRGFALDNNILVKNIPGASMMMKLSKNVVNKTAPKLERAAEETIKKYIHSNLKATLKQSKAFLINALDGDEITDISMKIWRSAKDKPLSTFNKYISEEDISEVLAMGYDHWKGFRKTEYYSSLLDEGIDFAFKQYGTMTLKELLTNMGIEKEMMLEDALLFAPDVIENLSKTGYIRDLYRRRLEPFFMSETTLALL